MQLQIFIIRNICLLSISVRSCASEPVEPYLGIEVDWPKKSYISGTQITYTCPYKKMTNQRYISGIDWCERGYIIIYIMIILSFKLAYSSILMYGQIYIVEQYVQCIWDKDTDEMIWYPDEIDECSRK